MQSMEPSMARQVVYEEFKRSLPGRSQEELRQLCLQLAELALVAQPAAIRWLVDEAAGAWIQRQPDGTVQLPPPSAWHEQLAAELLGDHQS